jgi:hypothetical protein
LWILMPSNLGTWSATITKPIPARKPHLHRVGHEVGEESEPQHRSQAQHEADHQRQRGERLQELHRVAIRHDVCELGAHEDGDGRGGGHAEHA